MVIGLPDDGSFVAEAQAGRLVAARWRSVWPAKMPRQGAARSSARHRGLRLQSAHLSWLRFTQ